MTMDGEGQNGYSDLMYSVEANLCVGGKQAEWENLLEEHGGKVPSEIERMFYSGVDTQRSSVLNAALFDRIHAFYLGALQDG